MTDKDKFLQLMSDWGVTPEVTEYEDTGRTTVDFHHGCHHVDSIFGYFVWVRFEKGGKFEEIVISE